MFYWPKVWRRQLMNQWLNRTHLYVRVFNGHSFLHTITSTSFQSLPDDLEIIKSKHLRMPERNVITMCYILSSTLPTNFIMTASEIFCNTPSDWKRPIRRPNTCNWGRFEATAYQPLICMEEGNQSGELRSVVDITTLKKNMSWEEEILMQQWQ